MLTFLILGLAASQFVSARLPYIINGKDVDYPGKYAWQASLQADGNHFCGGALISKDWVVSAAHCIVMGPKSQITVKMGMHSQSDVTRGQPASYLVEKTIAHADFNIEVQFIRNDIALLKLATPVDLNNPYVELIPMAKKGDDFLGAECVLTGWGRNDPNEYVIPDILQETTTTAITREECEQLWWMWRFKIVDTHICFYTGKTGACQGDSGGPAACKTSGGSWVLAGVTSGGSPICNVKRPSIYTRISEYRDWISGYSGL